MRFTALGGAQEIGASCYLLEIDGKNILLDAGLRMKQQPEAFDDSLPLIGNIERLDAICVSHAHLDHIGALGAIFERFPKTPTFMTIPTFPIAATMLLDVARRVEREREQYSQRARRQFGSDMLERIADYTFTTKFNMPFHPFADRRNLSITFLPAGHVLGAAGIQIMGEEGTAFYTGDFSGPTQRTVPGASFSVDTPVDILITETTYGDRLHQDRQVEENRCADVIAETVARGGSVLIPTYAFGRAQEVILVLQEAQAEGKIPLVPIFVDGLTRTICDHYEELIQPHILFRKDAPAPIIRVDSPETRRYVFAGSPCIVIASSGMLIGGPSVSYALELLPNRKNALVFVAYNDEESPGSKLSNLQRGEKLLLGREREEVCVEAAIHTLHLSAHADQKELVRTARAIQPHTAIGVHGEKSALNAFANALRADGFTERIETPKNGEMINL